MVFSEKKKNDKVEDLDSEVRNCVHGKWSVGNINNGVILNPSDLYKIGVKV